MAVVSNSSPLIALARIQRLDLLPAIFEAVLIPPAVAREIAPSISVLPSWLRTQVPDPDRPTVTVIVTAAPKNQQFLPARLRDAKAIPI